MKRSQTIFAIALFALVSARLAVAGQPNILVILADDLGYSDIGCYGGEIATPNINAMANAGLQFTRFRGTPMCVTSRIALMAGMPMDYAGGHAYSHAAPLPMVMKQAGYRTMMTGKWHAGEPDPRSKDLFDRSFGFLGGMTDCFIGGNDWFLDDQPFNDFANDFYSTTAFADKSIEFMKESVAMKKPFLMYVALNAPHHPCQAPEATVKKYENRYGVGYDAIRQQRRAKQIEMGLIDPAWTMTPLGNEVRVWDQLSDHRRRIEAGRMAAYAAAVDEVDIAVGKLTTFVRDAGIEDDTIVIFLSDNGGDYSNGSIDGDEKQIAWKPHGNPSSSNGWAAVKATPFRYYKHACHEGGIAVPMVIQWPAGISLDSGDRVDAAASIVDLYPTLIELAGATYPAEFAGHATRPLAGSSLVPLMKPNGHRESKPVFEYYDFSRSWIDDEWKAVSLYNGPWQLFDLRSDRGESIDLAAQHPHRLKQLSDRWIAFADESGIPNATEPVSSVQHGWGWHRLKMACPSLVAMTPANGSVTESTSVRLRIEFAGAIDFRGTENRSIRVYCEPDEATPIWTLDPDATHPSQGKRQVDLGELPMLEPGKQYYVLWDPGWIRVDGRPVGPLNDGAYWWRFTTPN
ncbi:sulfatase-like hydrolase/transferase [Rubripirellula tenax]|uniref:sulfatase-like hydrolase/transferase n=1 Tax=Rubripirellula tenax TaxID=2528015 RepID=UPI0011B62BCF|nr:sulfatase-like hydrolase/transferase [Rubripirellula tenax]